MSSSTKVVVKDKGKKKARVLFWSAECRYSVIIERVNEHDWKTVDDEKQQGKVNIFWIDCATIHEHFRSIQPWQCINHFPGMPNIARKNKMGQNLNKMLKAYPKEYSFYPRTWILPGEIADFRNQFDSNGNSIGNKIYIIKPDAGCQGRGIYLTKTWEKVPLNENVVAQLYIKKPLLVDGFKFDLRIYVFVTSVKPLRVYLFHDGLVRMCTETYVKPTSKNLDQSCMHLTNYAVNKHNENFQQPSDDDGDSGHKRSLQWFMDWIRAEHGDAKANWVWKRMGVIIMRTLLSIMPILSREYDQHFKSFTGVPVDTRKIAGAGVGYTASQPSSSSASTAGASGGEGASRAGRLQSRSNSIKGTDRSQSKERDQDTDEENSSQNGKDDRKDASSDGQQNESEGEGEEGASGPKMRGSRCFEVLGYDIMLDSNLNPWVIEVNHLPSFGTDSPMDQDIKQRLMEQVFSVLPVMADDQVAYAAHHKAESEKRLVAQNRISANAKKEREMKEASDKVKSKPPLRPREPKKDYSVLKADGTLGVDANSKLADKGDTDGARAGGDNTGGDDEDSDNYDEDVTPERLLEIKVILFDVYSKHSQEKLNKIDRLLAKYATHEEEFLRFVLNKYNVNPALYKSQSKAAAKNGTATPRDPSPAQDTTPQGELLGAEDPPSSANEDRPGTADGSAHSVDEEEEENGNDTADESAAAEVDRLQIDTAGTGEDGNVTSRSSGPKTDSNANRNQARESSKRASRSMSPPRSSMPSGAPTSTRRAAAAWKTSTEEEDAKFRAEVLAMHVPKDDDEWLLFETSKLTEFTRLYPIMKPTPTSANSSSSASGAQAEAAAEAALEVEVQGEDEADEDEEEGGGNSKEGSKDPLLTPGSSTKNKEKAKSATYEELIFQAFLLDRRQTMRMHQPLQNRQKVVTDDNVGSSFLPPLDSGRSYSTINSSGKGAVGWKAPPKPARETIVRQPTQGQSDAAKRLSQGLSVTNVNHTARQRYIAQNHLNLPNALASTGYSVVLDPHEYTQMQASPSVYGAGAGAGANASSVVQSASLLGGPYVPVYGGIYPAFTPDPKSEALWPSTKANRLLEESRLNRLRLEAAKANSAAVVRQQVFYFDPNYRDQTGAIPTDGLTLIPPQGGGMPQGATSASTGGLLNTEYYDANGSMMDDASRAPTLQPAPQQGQQQQQSRFAAHVGGSAKHVSGAAAGSSLGGSVKVRPIPTLTNARHASTGNMNATLQAAAQAHGAGTSSHSQEELLRQLFPSWF